MNDTSHYWDSLADILILGAFVVVVITLGFFVRDRGQAFRSLFVIWAIVYVCRTLTLSVTRSPRLTSAEPYRPSNPFLGAILFMGGVKATATDFMFSGHAASFMLFANTVARYTYHGWFSVLFWMYSIVGILAVISTRQHYTVDVVVGVLISQLVFWVFHLAFDPEFLRWWVPGVDIEMNQPIQLVYPLTLRDATGQEIQVESRRKKQVVYSTRHFSRVRYHLYQAIKDFLV